MKALTIFTPTYNRAHCLRLGYESLIRQTNKDFKWLIIDDGSTDNTKELVDSWIADGHIEIEYHFKENGGMHTGHNAAYRLIDTELNTCIDSDDYMPDDAVEKIITFWRRHGSDKYAGIVGLDQVAGGEVIGSRFPPDLKETTLTGYYNRGGKGDKKLVYRTEVIRNYPEYPVFEGERYLGLGYKYCLIDRDYPLLVLNEVLCLVDYQADGSSINMYRQYWNNPKGFAFIRITDMQYVSKGFFARFKTCIHYVSSSIMAKNKKYLAESPLKVLTFLASPFGLALYLWVRYKVKYNIQMLTPR
jgi:glycosyltransferase involved in cell wall biosynthesis